MENNITINTEISSLDIDKACRCCLNNSGTLRSIFITKKFTDTEIRLIDMLMECANVQISENESLPLKLCETCTEKLQNSYTFKKKCEATDTILRNYYDKIKEEEVDSDSDYEPKPLDVLISEEKISTRRKYVRRKKIQSKETVKPLKRRKRSNKTAQIKTENVDLSIKNEDDKNNLKTENCENNEIKTETDTDAIKTEEPDKKPLSDVEKASRNRNRSRMKNGIHRTILSCPHCDYKSPRSSLNIHMRVHTKEQPYSCEFCGRRFSFNGNLQRHLKIHTGDRPHKCTECDKAFIQHASLLDHARVHSGEKIYKCDLCDRSFTQAGQLRKHVRLHVDPSYRKTHAATTANKPSSNACHTCPICHKSFNTRSILKVHSLIHGPKDFLCSDCGRGFVSKAGLASHYRTHSGARPYACETCGKAFSQTGSLKAHLLIHTGVKPYVCSVCGKAFTQRNHLRYHLRIHTGERPYVCNICNKSFTVNGTLTVHMRLHTGETPFICDHCGKGFYDSSSLKKHTKSHT